MPRSWIGILLLLYRPSIGEKTSKKKQQKVELEVAVAVVKACEGNKDTTQLLGAMCKLPKVAKKVWVFGATWFSIEYSG